MIFVSKIGKSNETVFCVQKINEDKACDIIIPEYLTLANA